MKVTTITFACERDTLLTELCTCITGPQGEKATDLRHYGSGKGASYVIQFESPLQQTLGVPTAEMTTTEITSAVRDYVARAGYKLVKVDLTDPVRIEVSANDTKLPEPEKLSF